ncbi:MAG: TetR family transcriptional regulator [Acidimicrobiia bacterium]|nr:TetR family transcriptional regulator [Acidimicrobiia bacterium]
MIGAAIRLGAAGGYEAVQMRDVARDADVALATVYHYFTSKDHLLAEAMVVRTASLSDRVDRRPLEGTAPSQRLCDYYDRACRALEAEPELTAALVTALVSNDPAVARSVTTVTARVGSEVSEVLQGHYEPGVCDAIVGVLGHVWFSTLISWASGRREIGDVGLELRRAIAVLCTDGGVVSS